MRQKHRTCLVCFILLAIIFSSCKESPVKIGFTASMSGAESGLGRAGYQGALMAVDEINSAGGIGGRPVELVEYDNEYNPQLLKSQISSISTAGIRYIIGPYYSMMTSAVRDSFDDDILFLSPTVGSDDFTGIDDNLIKINSDNNFLSEAAAGFMTDSGFSRIAIVHVNYNQVYTMSLIDGLRRHIERKGGSVVITSEIQDENALVYEDSIEPVLESGAEAIFLIGNSYRCALVCQELYKNSIDIPVVMSSWAMNDDFLKYAGRAAEGAYFLNVMDIECRQPFYLSFRRNYIERYGATPIYSAALSYEAVKILADAIGRSAAPGDIEAVKEQIRRPEGFRGLQQTVYFDKNGDCRRSYYQYRVEDGVFEKINVRTDQW